MRKNKTNTIINFLELNGKWTGLLIISSIVGTFLAITKRNYEPLFFNLYHFVNLEVGKGSSINLVKDSVIAYGLQLGSVWLCGLSPVGKYLGKTIFICTGVSYSFTVTSIILLYGIKGIVVVILTCGIQMFGILSMMMYLGNENWETYKKNKGNSKIKYYYMIGYIMLLVMSLGMFNVYVQPTLEKLIKLIIY